MVSLGLGILSMTQWPSPSCWVQQEAMDRETVAQAMVQESVAVELVVAQVEGQVVVWVVELVVV